MFIDSKEKQWEYWSIAVTERPREKKRERKGEREREREREREKQHIWNHAWTSGQCKIKIIIKK